MTYSTSGSSSLVVASETEVARWVQARSRSRVTRVEALEVEGRPAAVFVADQLLVDGDDRDLLAQLVGRHGAKIIERPPLPPSPEGLGPTKGMSVEGMPLPILVQLSRAPAPTARALELVRAVHGPTASVTSESSGRLLGLAAELSASGKGVGLNLVARQSALSLANPVERDPVNPLDTPAFVGRARVAAAWQLVETFRQFRSTKPVTIGILDAGFWLNGFTPFVPVGQVASDLGSSVGQLNLMDEGVGAGGASGMDGQAKPWHGNGSASVAAAKVGNALGACGVGGSVARPVLFKTDGSLAYFFRCLEVCLGWGIDILNVSLAYDVESGAGEWYFPTSVWNRSFQFASDHGLIVVAGAGNDGNRLPEDSYVRPATRTPGTITVGAVDGSDRAQSYSNFGASVDIWAPTDIPVIPNENYPTGTTHGGTSAAAPFVSGVVAMMRAVAPLTTLDFPTTKRLLLQSGWQGTDKVGVGVDAYAAVLAAMGGRLPYEEADAHATPQTARALRVGPGGALMPFLLRSAPELAALASKTGQNWYKFAVSGFSTLDVQLNFYPLLGNVGVALVPDDPDGRALSDLVQSFSRGSAHLSGVLAPGSYKLSVSGGLNLYELSVRIADASLPKDEFEGNDSFEKSTRFILRESEPPPLLRELAHPAGKYDLTLHAPSDEDFFRVDPKPANPLTVPTLRVSLSDAPLDVVVLDAEKKVLDQRLGVRSAKLTFPRVGTSFVRISGARQTRYRLTLRLEVDPAHLPGSVQEQAVIPLPDLGDPPFQVDDGVTHVGFQVDSRPASNVLALASEDGQRLRVDLLDSGGQVVRTGSSRQDARRESVQLSVEALAPGTYVLRVQAADAPSQSAASPLTVQRVPSFR
jgi:Subtilase family